LLEEESRDWEEHFFMWNSRSKDDNSLVDTEENQTNYEEQYVPSFDSKACPPDSHDVKSKDLECQPH